MQVQLQMIGTGSAFAKTYYNNNALISCNGYTLMIDCGITAPWSLHRMNVPFRDIQGVLVTHLHADHIGGLEEYALQMRYVYNLKPTLYIAADLITLLSEHSLKAGMFYTEDIEMTLESFFDVVPLQPDVRQEIQPGLTVELIRTMHVPKMISYSLILNDNLFYSGDLVFDSALLQDLVDSRKCDYILHDCQLDGVGAVHTTLAQLMTLPEHVQEKILLMHYGDNMPSYIGKSGKMTFIEQHKSYTFASRT